MFCEGKHRASQCNVVTDVVTRKRLLRQKSTLLSLSFFLSFIMGNCKNQLYKCATCHGKHNISICDGNDRLSQLTEKQPIRCVCGEAKAFHSSVPKSEEVNSDLRDVTQPVRKTSNNVMHVNTGTNCNCVLLQTAIADVSKPNYPNV